MVHDRAMYDWELIIINNNSKTCNAHVSTLLGVQGAEKPTTNKTKQNKEKQTQKN